MVTVLDPYLAPQGWVVAAMGHLDVEGGRALAQCVDRVLTAGGEGLVVDLRSLSGLDAGGAGTLLRIAHRCALTGVPLHVVADDPVLLDALERVALRSRLHVVGSVTAVAQCCRPYDLRTASVAAAVPG